MSKVRSVFMMRMTNDNTVSFTLWPTMNLDS
jgi:hypothetical protein